MVLAAALQHKAMIALLLAHGACNSPKAANAFVHSMCLGCDVKNLHTLMQLGADPHKRDLLHRTLLHAAVGAVPRIATTDRIATATYLIDLGVDVNAVDEYHSTALVFPNLSLPVLISWTELSRSQ